MVWFLNLYNALQMIFFNDLKFSSTGSQFFLYLVLKHYNQQVIVIFLWNSMDKLLLLKCLNQFGFVWLDIVSFWQFWGSVYNNARISTCIIAFETRGTAELYKQWYKDNINNIMKSSIVFWCEINFGIKMWKNKNNFWCTLIYISVNFLWKK